LGSARHGMRVISRASTGGTSRPVGKRPRAHARNSSAPLKLQLFICLDTYILLGVYTAHGIRIRNHCGAEPPRDIGPPGLVPTVGGRDRASASYAAAGRIQAPAGAARGRFRGIHGGCAAPSLPAET